MSEAPLLALKIDVDTYRGTREGVPRLLDLLKKTQSGASFLFSLGPDHTGRAITRVFRPGFVKKVQRTSVIEHYGLKTLLYGTLLPGPDIGTQCADLLRATAREGFEVGIHTWDHIKWQDGVSSADAQWTEREMRLAVNRFTEIFGEAPRCHGAAGWQMNIHALRLTQRLGFDYCSDTRGHCPFMPVYRAEPLYCPQLPTTLPTLDELLGREQYTAANVAARVLQLTERSPLTYHPTHQVYTLHAELEGMKLLPVFQQLIEGWQQQGYRLVAMNELFAKLRIDELPRHEVRYEEVPGRSGKLLVQAEEF